MLYNPGVNWNLESERDVNALVLVAHPDDETIFCGGTMLSYPDWKWTVVCVTMQTETERPQEFRKAMEMFRALGVNIESFLTLEKYDAGHQLSEEEKTDWHQSASGLNLSPDIVFTHNEEGEYGHNHHKYISNMANELFPNVWEFICPGARNVAPQPFKDENNIVPLSVDILNKKMEIFNRCYTSQLACWRELSDLMVYEFKTGPEIFTRKFHNL